MPEAGARAPLATRHSEAGWRLALVVWLSAACAFFQNDGATSPTPLPVDLAEAVIDYYDIHGDTEDELRLELDRLGPLTDDGHRWDARTEWYIAWRWSKNLDGTCRLSEATVSYEITVTLPRWSPPAEASAELVAKWQRYFRSLVTHERGHVAIVLNYVPQVRAAVQGAASCEAANEAAQAVLATVRQKNAQYDAETQHGATQGARFP